MLSGIVQLADINDFINPNQNCVKPLLSTPSSSNTSAKINLIDCLACNGCITSAETVLIQEHSLSKHFDMKNKERKLSIAIISPQSVESICYKFKINRETCLTIIDRILQCDMYFNIEDINTYMLDLIYQEFINRNKSVICSGCPGWVCYAEKKVGANAFQYMSKLKSSQEIMSIIIRKLILSKCNMFINNDLIYICTLMPCFDKKIESVRNANEIDCVLSTIEIENEIKELLNQTNSNSTTTNNEKCVHYCTCCSLVETINKFHSSKYENDLTFGNFTKFICDCDATNNVHGSKCVNDFTYYENDSSGGYVEYILNRILKENKEFTIERKKGRNIDIKEIIIYDNKGNKYCSLCIAYGFRNVQNIVRNLKQNKIQYDYIELMACPGGCYNGGGQLRNENTKPRELLLQLESNSLPYIQKCSSNQSNIHQLLHDNNIQVPYTELTQQFHAIEYSMSNLKW